MLRIPASGDEPPPLLAALRRAEPEPGPDESGQGKLKKRKRGRRKGGDDHAWEKQPAGYRSGRGENRQMRWLLAGGATLLVAALAAFSYSMMAKKAAVPVVDTTGAAPLSTAAPEPPKKLSDAEFLTLAEALAKRFLAAKSVDELLPLVRNPGTVEAKMRSHYPGGKVDAPGLFLFNQDRQPVTIEGITKVRILTGEQVLKQLAFEDSPQGLKIDWESWAGWSEMTWEEFLNSKPTEAKMFRVILGSVDYYNFDFSDEKKWKSYRLTSPDKEDSVFGYAEKESILAERLRLNADTKEARFMLLLKFPPNSRSTNQVLIEKVIADGWIERGGAK